MTILRCKVAIVGKGNTPTVQCVECIVHPAGRRCSTDNSTQLVSFAFLLSSPLSFR